MKKGWGEGRVRRADQRTAMERVVLEEAVLKQGTAVDYSDYQKCAISGLNVHSSPLLSVTEFRGTLAKATFK